MTALPVGRSPLASALARVLAWTRDVRVRRVVLEAVTLGLVAALVIYIGMRAREASSLNFDFMQERAGFGIGDQFLTQADGSSTRWHAYFAGVMNTLRITIFGILLSLGLGLGIGVARLSTNWLAAKLAFLYVEAIRNTPLLVFVVFCYTAVVLRLPRIQESASLFGVAHFSNRAIALPWPRPQDGAGAFALALLGGLVVAWGVWRVLARREVLTGRPSYPWRGALAVFVAAALVAFVATGMPLRMEAPEVTRFSYAAGLRLSPEFVGLLLALSLFNAAFVAEIVRGAIEAVPRGEREAAAALGLSGWQQLHLIVLPQALRTMLPPLATQCQNLAKMSSVGIVIAFPDLMTVGGTVINNSGEAIPVFVLMMATYFALNLVIAFLLVGPQWRFNWSTGRRA
ncbi:MAG: ABC transporter permease subunit [Dehalococcoidia bacterium]|nr:ABC transporter permease subunit [Dehalococcoidia bacterium]